MLSKIGCYFSGGYCRKLRQVTGLLQLTLSLQATGNGEGCQSMEEALNLE
ncbi:hypothetical protein [Gimesia sp.]|nr:hypothetical protein [Gimesia sp.]|tara:strand:+ start:187 stop:336 length:150 start_codon:yes stop_codon:yes gene_type:complete